MKLRAGLALTLLVAASAFADPATHVEYDKARDAYDKDAKSITITEAEAFDATKGTCVIATFPRSPSALPHYEMFKSKLDLSVTREPIQGDYATATITLITPRKEFEYGASGPLRNFERGDLQNYATTTHAGETWVLRKAVRLIESKNIWMVRFDTGPKQNGTNLVRLYTDAICYYWKE